MFLYNFFCLALSFFSYNGENHIIMSPNTCDSIQQDTSVMFIGRGSHFIVSDMKEINNENKVKVPSVGDTLINLSSQGVVLYRVNNVINCYDYIIAYDNYYYSYCEDSMFVIISDRLLKIENTSYKNMNLSFTLNTTSTVLEPKNSLPTEMNKSFRVQNYVLHFNKMIGIDLRIDKQESFKMTITNVLKIKNDYIIGIRLNSKDLYLYYHLSNDKLEVLMTYYGE